MSETKMRGLALSGGGFRATLFHLGVIRYLYDAERSAPEGRALSGITHITSVSGGSVIAAHLVLNWERYTGSEVDFETAASEIISFVRSDVRGRIIRRIPLLFPYYWLTVILRRTPILSEDTNLHWTRVSTTDLLERNYSKYLFRGKKLADLKAPKGRKRPVLYLLTTNIDEGNQVAFTSKGLETGNSNVKAYAGLPLGRAVAASSAFPGMFPAVSCRPPSLESALKLMDGGVYDNLGVKKFQALLESPNTEFSDVIVCDASVRFKPASRRGFFEPVTTPFRAADILFKRVYDFDKESAIRTDKRFDCSFTFLSLRDKVDSDLDEFALLNEHQDQLESVRTDLDKFSELEIAALIRHGYCIARSKLSDPSVTAEPSSDESLWNPVPLTRDKAAREMISRDSNDHAEAISDRLRSSATRKFRFFSFRDPASYLAVLILFTLVFGYLFIVPAAILYWRSSVGSKPPVDLAAVSSKISESRKNYRNALWSRMEAAPSANGFSGAATTTFKPGSRAVHMPLETWTTSQAVYSLLKDREVDPDEIAFLVRALDDRFQPSTSYRESDWVTGVGGWYTRPSEHHFQAEPALWTLAALCAIQQREELRDLDRSNLKARTAQIQKYLIDNKFIVSGPGSLAFNVLANQQQPEAHSAYSTSLGLLALIEMRQAHLTWDAGDVDQMIEATLGWLSNSYDDRSGGWKSVDADSNGPMDEAANLQILALMLKAYNELGRIVPDNMKQRVRQHIDSLAKNFPPDSSARVYLNTADAKGAIHSDEISITFLWRPWAIRLCRSWMNSLSSADSDEKAGLAEVIDKLTGNLSEVERSDKTDYTFHSAEMLIALSD